MESKNELETTAINEKLGAGFTSLFLQIDNEADFIEAIHNDVSDTQAASLIWHSLQSMYTALNSIESARLDGKSQVGNCRLGTERLRPKFEHDITNPDKKALV